MLLKLSQVTSRQSIRAFPDLISLSNITDGFSTPAAITSLRFTRRGRVQFIAVNTEVVDFFHQTFHSILHLIPNFIRGKSIVELTIQLFRARLTCSLSLKSFSRKFLLL